MRLWEKTRWCISGGLSSNSKMLNKNIRASEKSPTTTLQIFAAVSLTSHSLRWQQHAGVSQFGVSAFKRAISFFTSLSIDSDISSLNPEVWEKSMHLSGLSLATKKLKPGSSFWGQVGHLLMIWCYQSGSGNIFCLIFSSDQIWPCLGQNDCSWRPPPLKSLHPEHTRRGGRRNSQTQDAKSSAQIHMCLTDRMKHFLRIALAGPGGPVSWLWCAFDSGLIRMCCWEFVCMTAKQKERLWLATGSVQRES